MASFPYFYRHARGRSPEQKKQSLPLFSSPGPRENFSVPPDQPVLQEGQEETEQCEWKPSTYKGYSVKYQCTVSTCEFSEHVSVHYSVIFAYFPCDKSTCSINNFYVSCTILIRASGNVTPCSQVRFEGSFLTAIRVLCK